MRPSPTVDAVLQKLRELGVSLPHGKVRVDTYGDFDALSKELLALIRSGQKRAGTGLVWLHEQENEPLPEAGDIEVVIDHQGQPSVVTRIVSVKVLPYGQVTAEYAAIEGEGDGSLKYWREAHWSYFARECQRIGREPSENMQVVCSVFEVLNVLPENAAA